MTMVRGLRWALIGVAMAAGGGSLAHAQTTVTLLNPTVAQGGSFCFSSGPGAGGNAPGLQGGTVLVNGLSRAGYWNSTSGSWADLGWPTMGQSWCFAVDGDAQVGAGIFLDGGPHAVLWRGTVGSWVRLGPEATDESEAFGVDGTMQCGYVKDFGVPDHAALWSGTAASHVDLHPAGGAESRALACAGDMQVGYTMMGGFVQAGLWRGTAASWLSLHPSGASFSYARGTDGVAQVGSAQIGLVHSAGMWTGTAASWVNLNPPGSTESFAYDVANGMQVGEAIIGGNYRACLWFGSAASLVDLHSSLTGFASSRARGIWFDAATGTAYISGYGFNSLTGRTEALLWKRTCAAPMFTGHPANRLICSFQSATFSAAAGGDVPVVYTWEMEEPAAPGTWRTVGNGALIINGVTWGQLADATTQTLRATPDISNHAVAATLKFRGVARNGCGEARSNAATLAVLGRPAITIELNSARVCPSQTVTFTMSESGSAPISRIWQWMCLDPNDPFCNGAWTAMVEGVNNDLNTGQPLFTASGLSGSSIQAIDARGPMARTASMRLSVRCFVYNDCGAAATAPVDFTTCPADFNCSGDVSVQDIFDFLAGYFAGDAAADFNGAGGHSVQDIFDFLAAYFGGCT